MTQCDWREIVFLIINLFILFLRCKWKDVIINYHHQCTFLTTAIRYVPMWAQMSPIRPTRLQLSGFYLSASVTKFVEQSFRLTFKCKRRVAAHLYDFVGQGHEIVTVFTLIGCIVKVTSYNREEDSTIRYWFFSFCCLNVCLLCLCWVVSL